MYQAQFGPRLTKMVKYLIIVNAVVFLIDLLSSRALVPYLAVAPFLSFETPWFWQLFTYQFMHGNFMHILFNMFALWMFGSELEERWGSNFFLKYYLVSGTGAGFLIWLLPVLLNQPTGFTLGASGAIFGILLAYAMNWPDRYLLFMFFFPIKVKYFVFIMGLVSLLFSLDSSGAGGISHVGHLGGLVSGWLYLFYLRKKGHSSYSGGDAMVNVNPLQKYKNYKKKKEWQRRQQEMYDMMHMEQKVDAILDKISRRGMKSLTRDEKRFLQKASETMNEKEKEQISGLNDYEDRFH